MDGIPEIKHLNAEVCEQRIVSCRLSEKQTSMGYRRHPPSQVDGLMQKRRKSIALHWTIVVFSIDIQNISLESKIISVLNLTFI